MSSRLLPEEFVMRKRRWLLAIVVLAAILGFCVLLSSVLRAYGESHYDYLTGVPTLSPQAGLA
jgi:hypothetical protein